MNDIILLLDLPVRIIYKSIRHTYFRVKANGIIQITTNKRASNERIQELLAKFYNSLQKQREQILAQEAQNLLSIQENGRIWRLGKEFEVRLLIGKTNNVIFNDSVCLLTMKDIHDNDLKSRTLTRYFKSFAKEHFLDRLKAHFTYFANLGYSLPRLSIKTMRTRWGSYSPQAHKINLNLALIYLDNSLIDYVVIHELCHLLELNHSLRFYQLMEKFLPNWYELKQKLNQFSYILI